MSNQKLKIAVIGAGGVGGYLAGKLVQSNLADVTLIARGKQLEAIQNQGLKIIDTDETFVVDPVSFSSSEGEIFDVIFITTKSYDFQSACESIASSADENTLIISLANGVNHKEELKNYLQQGLICDACVYIISHVESPGVIRKKSPLFYLQFGLDSKNEKMTILEKVLNQSGLKAKLSDQIIYDCWKKYLFIASFATMTSYFQESMDSVMQNHPEVVYQVLEEIKSIANKLDIPITDKDAAKVIKQAQNVPKGSKTSMQLDFEQGKKTELETLTGYIVRLAKKLDIEVPSIENMYKALLKKCL